MRKLVLLEGMPKYEGINEAEALTAALKVMMKAYDARATRNLELHPYTVSTKEEFLRLMELKTDFLHISAHGRTKRGHTILDITHEGQVTADDVWNLDIKAKVVFVNACQTSRRALAEAFLEDRGRKEIYYIAPHAFVPFDEAFLVALLFYQRIFLEKRASYVRGLNYVRNLPNVKAKYTVWVPD